MKVDIILKLLGVIIFLIPSISYAFLFNPMDNYSVIPTASNMEFSANSSDYDLDSSGDIWWEAPISVEEYVEYVREHPINPDWPLSAKELEPYLRRYLYPGCLWLPGPQESNRGEQRNVTEEINHWLNAFNVDEAKKKLDLRIKLRPYLQGLIHPYFEYFDTNNRDRFYTEIDRWANFVVDGKGYLSSGISINSLIAGYKGGFLEFGPNPHRIHEFREWELGYDVSGEEAKPDYLVIDLHPSGGDLRNYEEISFDVKGGYKARRGFKSPGTKDFKLKFIDKQGKEVEYKISETAMTEEGELVEEINDEWQRLKIKLNQEQHPEIDWSKITQIQVVFEKDEIEGKKQSGKIYLKDISFEEKNENDLTETEVVEELETMIKYKPFVEKKMKRPLILDSKFILEDKIIMAEFVKQIKEGKSPDGAWKKVEEMRKEWQKQDAEGEIMWASLIPWVGLFYKKEGDFLDFTFNDRSGWNYFLDKINKEPTIEKKKAKVEEIKKTIAFMYGIHSVCLLKLEQQGLSEEEKRREKEKIYDELEGVEYDPVDSGYLVSKPRIPIEDSPSLWADYNTLKMIFAGSGGKAGIHELMVLIDGKLVTITDISTARALSPWPWNWPHIIYDGLSKNEFISYIDSEGNEVKDEYVGEFMKKWDPDGDGGGYVWYKHY